MNRRPRPILFLPVALLAALVLLAPPAGAVVSGEAPTNNVLKRALDIELGRARRAKYEQGISSGTLYAVLAASGELDRRARSVRAPQVPPVPRAGSQGCPNAFTGGGKRNIRVNQDCSLRRQAEEVIAINPLNLNNLIVGQNDSRIGFNHCGYDFSFDGGRTWGDMIPPFWQFLMDDDHTADACSDPTVSFDGDGNAYIAGILFQIASPASALVVAKSNAGLGGMYYHSPVPGPFQTYATDPLGVVASDNNPDIFHDKEFIVADASPTSPKRNHVYVTWTRFANHTGAGVDLNSPIYFSQSTDGGATWSPGIEISGANPAVCTAFSGSGNPNACDQDQGSHPVVGPDGTIYVAFANFNTPILGENQVLFVKCPGTADCTNPANWTAPVKVADLIGKHPFGPDPATGCPEGRQCLPPNGYRVPEATSISTAVDTSGKLYVTWADFRNGGGTCDWNDGAEGQAALATPPCDNDVFYAHSSDGGATWSAPIQVSPAGSAQWQPWSAVVPNGNRLWIAYYDRSYGACEFTGCQDITLAGVQKPTSGAPMITRTRLTSASMPNLVMANNPLQAGFLGDYMWVAVDRAGRAHVVWADTRGLGGAVEEDIYYTRYP